MVEFEDITLREGEGKYDKVVEIMKADGAGSTWMLRSKTFVSTDFISGVFLLNFWNDGKVMIDEMYRPISLEVPNDDIAELSNYVKDNGWKPLEPTNKMMENPRLNDFWKRQYQSGLIVSTVLEEREADIVDRLIKSEEKNNDKERKDESDRGSVFFKE